MFHHELLHDHGILVVLPQGPLETEDFAMLSRKVGPFIALKGKLNGLMIYSESFPGSSDFATLINHLKFVKEHHRRI